MTKIIAHQCLFCPTVLLLLVSMAPIAAEGLNLFISREEMFRTLGVWAEMFYVSDGEVNEYSTKFPYILAENITNLAFTWNNPNRRDTLVYSIEASSSNFDVLPILRFPPEGIVPTDTESFVIDYRCVGARSGQFHIVLKFNISIRSTKRRSPLHFTLKQEKICTTMDGRRAFAGQIDDDDANGAFARFLSSIPFGIGGLVAVLSLLSLCVGILCACLFYSQQKKKTSGGYARNRFQKLNSSFRDSLKNRLRITTNPTATTTQSKSVSKVCTPVCLDDPFSFENQQPSTSSAAAQLSAQNTDSLLANNEVPLNNNTETTMTPRIIFDRWDNIVDINIALVELNADRNLFEVNRIRELEGTFGEVVCASWRQVGATGTGHVVDDVDDREDDATTDTAVICKTLKPDTDRSHFEKFLIDALRFHNVPAHPNLAQVMAAATFGNFSNPDSVKDLPLICYRHSGFGILKKFLLSCRKVVRTLSSHQDKDPKEDSSTLPNEPNPIGVLFETSLRIYDLIGMAIQACNALQHLHSFGVLHRDVATRNCFVSKLPNRYGGFHVQLCDCALSRDIFPDEYYKPQTASHEEDTRPVKWMPPESLKNNVFSSSSDVWSFGIFIWELFTCGQQPYSEVDPGDMQAALLNGSRLVQPYNSPDELYGIMLSCWKYESLKRPTTTELSASLQEFANQLRRYI